jgi:signal transduction histidine kinase
MICTQPPVAGFPGELKQVGTNIIDNAIDVLPDAGHIRVVAATFGE